METSRHPIASSITNEYANINRSVHNNKRHEAKIMLQSQCHNALINWSNLHYRRLESALDNYGYPLEMVTMAPALPVVGVSTYTDCAACQVFSPPGGQLSQLSTALIPLLSYRMVYHIDRIFQVPTQSAHLK